jgi:molybdate/tungstate transport system ATP-binding protein
MIAFENVTISNPGLNIENINFEIPKKSWGVLMGKIGSGKTTILEAVCGLKQISSGKILLMGKDVTSLHPSERNIGYLPQDSALFPTMTVFENIAFAMKIRKWENKRILSRVTEIAGILKIENIIDRKIQRLSGGETQMAALARALSFEPSILCLDEPLNSLDGETKGKMYAALRAVKENTGITAICVTHSDEEAGEIGDLKLMIRDGKILACP